MTHDEYAMSSPPTEGEFVDETQSKWPTVFGVISIIIGSLGILCYGCNSVGTIMQPMLSGMAPQGQQAAPPPPALQAFNIAQYCGMALLGIWLLAAGIGVVKRSAWAPKALVGWAIVRLLLMVIFTVLSFVFMQQIVDAFNQQMQASQQGGQAPPFTMSTGIMSIMVVVGIVFGSWWPITVLIWMRKPRVQQEIEEWREAARTMV